MGGIDIVILNAGIEKYNPILYPINYNLNIFKKISQICAPYLLSSKSPQLIVNCSIENASKNLVNYIYPELKLIRNFFTRFEEVLLPTILYYLNLKQQEEEEEENNNNNNKNNKNNKVDDDDEEEIEIEEEEESNEDVIEEGSVEIRVSVLYPADYVVKYPKTPPFDWRYLLGGERKVFTPSLLSTALLSLAGRSVREAGFDAFNDDPSLPVLL